MKTPIKTGDSAIIIISGCFEKDSPNLGKQVTVGLVKGHHSEYGPIWIVHGEGLISEYGAVGNTIQCAADWLQKIEPPIESLEKEITKEIEYG